MEIRNAHAQDFEKCVPLLQQLWPFLKLAGYTAKAKEMKAFKKVFIQVLNDPNAQIMIAEADGQIVAFLDLTFRKTLFHRGWTMIIEDLIVDEAHRRKGIGKRLAELCEDLAREKGCHAIELSSDLHRKETHLFWEALGYEGKAYQFRKVIG
jgi:GNAT superfamily N-acetyltransferase